MRHTVCQRADIGGVRLFCREARPPDAPAILLHGFPSSARQWEPLLARLAGDFHLVAPDYPGFGHSDAPDPAGISYIPSITWPGSPGASPKQPAWTAAPCPSRTTAARSDSGWPWRIRRGCGP